MFWQPDTVTIMLTQCCSVTLLFTQSWSRVLSYNGNHIHRQLLPIIYKAHTVAASCPARKPLAEQLCSDIHTQTHFQTLHQISVSVGGPCYIQKKPLHHKYLHARGFHVMCADILRLSVIIAAEVVQFGVLLVSLRFIETGRCFTQRQQVTAPSFAPFPLHLPHTFITQ